MAFDIAIKVDPGNSVATSKQVENALDRLEEQGKKTNQVVGGLKQSAEASARGFMTLEKQLEAEKRALAGMGIEAERAASMISLSARKEADAMKAVNAETESALAKVGKGLEGVKGGLESMTKEVKRAFDLAPAIALAGEIQRVADRIALAASSAAELKKALADIGIGGIVGNTGSAVKGATDIIAKYKEANDQLARTNFFSAVGRASDALGDISAEVQKLARITGAVEDPWFAKPDKVKATAQALKEIEAIPRNVISPDFASPKQVTNGFAAPVDYTVDAFAPPAIDFETMRANLEKSAAGVRDMQAALAELNLAKARDEAEKLGAAFQPLTGYVEDFLRTGELSGEKFLATLDEIAIKLLEMAALQAIGPGGGAGAGFLTGILGGKTGFDYTVSNDPLQRPGFATGGDFMVRGPGGTDTRLIQFWATPGESVHVRTPEQRAAAQRVDTSPVKVTNVIQVSSDPREITGAIGSWSGQKEVVKLNRTFDRRR